MTRLQNIGNDRHDHRFAEVTRRLYIARDPRGVSGVVIMGIAALLFAGALVVLTDQASKALAMRRLEEGRFFAVAGRIGLRRVMNPQAGLIRLSDRQAAALWILIVAVLGLIIAVMGTLPVGFGIALGLVMGGASSNLYDRFARGSVIDFIAVRGWRTFNLADASMVAGTVLAWGAL